MAIFLLDICQRWVIKYGLILLTGFFIGRNYPDILNQVVIQAERYTGLITAITTVALVLVTTLLVDLNKKLWLTQNKPLLYFYKEIENFGQYSSSPYVILKFFVRNVGNGPATKVDLKIDQKDFYFKKSSPVEYFEVLSPGEKTLIFTIEETKFTQEITIDDIVYNDFNGMEYSQEKVTFKSNN